MSERMARAAAERLAVWNILREISGAAGPFTERIHEALTRELEAEQRTQIESSKAEHDRALAGLRSGSDPEMLARLTDRLMALAGYTREDPPQGNGA
jgi:hypothetical protein